MIRRFRLYCPCSLCAVAFYCIFWHVNHSGLYINHSSCFLFQAPHLQSPKAPQGLTPALQEPHHLLPPQPSPQPVGQIWDQVARFLRAGNAVFVPVRCRRCWCGCSQWEGFAVGLGRMQTSSWALVLLGWVWAGQKPSPGLCSHVRKLGKSFIKITRWSESCGWETSIHDPGASLAPAGGSPGLSRARWWPPSSNPLLPYMLRHFAFVCLFAFSYVLFNQPIINISSASVCSVQDTDILGICNLDERFSPASSSAQAWMEKDIYILKNIPLGWVNAARLPWLGIASHLPKPLSPWAGGQPQLQPQLCSHTAETEPAGKMINWVQMFTPLALFGSCAY